MTEKPDKFHQHEVLHTAHVLMQTWHDNVTNALYTQSDPSLVFLAEVAEDAMMLLYQAVGQEEK